MHQLVCPCLQRALQFFHELRQQGLQTSVITYSARISACGKGKMTVRALLLCEVMRRLGLLPDLVS